MVSIDTDYQVKSFSVPTQLSVFVMKVLDLIHDAIFLFDQPSSFLLNLYIILVFRYSVSFAQLGQISLSYDV